MGSKILPLSPICVTEEYDLGQKKKKKKGSRGRRVSNIYVYVECTVQMPSGQVRHDSKGEAVLGCWGAQALGNLSTLVLASSMNS